MHRQLRIREPIGGLRTRIVTAEEIDRFRHRHPRIANPNTMADDVDLEAIRSHEL
jgi:hypothetical protein